jgi:DNA invertase Pin-like site-specific DNA recombinase
MTSFTFPPGTQAYSYIRFSTPEQLKGDSLRRHLKGSQEWADEHGLPLDTQLRDLGLSGYTGANRIKGALGKFHELVNNGSIPQGSVLIVDR